MTSSAVDLPTGAQVTAGTASVQTPAKGAMLINQSTQRAVIKWNDFSIGQGKQVTFAQPNAGAATLNIVNGNSASSIAGTLSSNGSVYLINQNGIAITPTGLVDTRAGFIASTLRMDENAFMGGKQIFSGKGGSVVNRGQIITGPGGTVGLLGSTVANEGLISAPLGKVALGSGEAATLDLSGDGFLQVMLPSSAVAADGQALVSNSGVIQANGGTVMLKAATVRQALREAVNMPGEITARSVSGQNGAIVLEAGVGGTARVTGSLTANGDATGGRIDVTGANVALEGASLSATGTERGGLVRVGGAFQGGREQPAGSADAALFATRFGSTPAISNATTTRIDAASSINVNATGAAGTGGTAIVWSDNTTVMQGAISARGASAGGAVEVSAKSTVQAVALKRIDLGKGGNLLIDPQDIVIDNVSPGDAARDYSYAPSGTTTHLLDADVTALLSTGANVSLQASQDISWLNNFTFVTRTPTKPGGNLNLSAGRSVTLSGIFTTADGNWNIVANDTAAHGVIDAERGAGAAQVELYNAKFINSNGNLSLTLADGAGNTNREVGRLTLGKFSGNGLNASILPTATPAYGATQILLTDDINVSGTISLTGNLQVVASLQSMLSLSGKNVKWTDEKTGATIFGEQGVKFIESGVTTRLGQLNGNDAARLELGGDDVTRTYGDADPTIANLITPQLRVAAHSTASAPDSLMDILSAGSLAVSGPGRYAAAGQNTLAVSATSNAAIAGQLQSGYFVDLTAATTPLTITRRSVTPTVSNGAYTYGSPAKVVALGNLVNGDLLQPVATLNGSPNVGMAVNGTGFGFGETLAAGNSAYALSGLAGSQAHNYFLDMSGSVAGTLDIARKPLNYVAQGGSHVYGSPGGLPLGALSGIVAQDDVSPQVALFSAGAPAALATKLAVGTYTTSVASFAGAQSSNYTMSDSGNTDGQYHVTAKTLTYAVANASSTYGTLASLGNSELYGVLAGDAVTATASLKDAAGNAASPSPTLAAGSYREVVSTISGTASSNYRLANSGNQEGTLAIARKQITYIGSDSTQTYGTGALPTPALNGVVGTDRVTAQQSVSAVQSQQQGGSGAVAVGEYKVDVSSLAGADSANYTVAAAGSGSTSGHALVTPKVLSYSLAPSSQIIYGDAAPDVPFSGIVSGDLIQGVSTVSNVAGTQTLVPTTDIGSYTRSVSSINGTGAGNYRLATSGNNNGNLTITPRSLTWQVDSGSAVYGNAVTNAVNLNLVPGDTVDASLSVLDASGAALARPGVGSYSVGVNTISGARAANYMLASTGNSSGTVQITPRPINYRATDTYSQYGAAVNAFGSESVELFRILPEDINQVHAVTSGGYLRDATGTPYFEGSWVPAGTYSRTSFNILGLDNKNYMLGINYTTPGDYRFHYVSKLPVYSSGTQTQSITYGDTYNPIRANLVGILPQDSRFDGVYANLDGNLSAQLMVVGDHVVNVGTLQGYAAANYYYASQPGAPLIVTVKQKPVILVYNQNGNLPNYFGNPLTSYPEYGVISDIAGLQSGQTPVTVYGLVPGGETGLLVQPQSPVFQLSSSGALNVGNYAWTPASFSSSNYVVANPGVGAKYLKVNPKQITSDLVYTSLEKRTPIYGETLGMLPPVHAVWGTNTIRPGDSIDVSFGFQDYSGRYVALSGRQSAGKYYIYPNDATGRDAANYQVTFKQPSDGLYLTILPRSIDARITSSSSTYGNKITIPTPVLNPLPGDSVSSTTEVSGFGAATNFEFQKEGYYQNAGKYYLKLGPLTGPSADNYKIGGQQDSYATQANRPLDELALFTIRQRPLKLVGSYKEYAITYGDSITPLVSISGVLPGDDVDTKANVLPSGGGTLIGLEQRLDAGVYSLQFPLTGRSSKNYAPPVQQNGLDISTYGTVSVAKRPVTVTNLTSEYGTTPRWTPVFNNVLAGDDLSSTAFGVQKENSYILGPVPTGLLDVGRYTMAPSASKNSNNSDNFLEGVLSGPGSSNYVFRYNTYNVSITPKVLVWTPNSNLTSTYGDAIDMGTLTGFLTGDVFNNNFPGVTYMKPSEFFPGTTTSYSAIQLKLNAPADVNVLNTPFNSVVPVRSLGEGYTQVIAATYSPFRALEPEVKITFSGYARRGGQYEYSRNLFEQQSLSEVKTYDRPVNVGTYKAFTPGGSVLSGVGASNYALPANMQETQWVVKPRVINYSVGNTTRQYGNYEGCNNQQCSFNIPATNLGNVSYRNLVGADESSPGIPRFLPQNIGLITATGEKGTSALITSNAPVGTTYIQVLDSINDNNYVLAKSGNQAGLLQIVPKFLTYSTSSAFYMPGIGLVGTPGTTTVNGINGGEQVTPVVSITDPFGRANVDLTSLVQGRYTFPVVGFTGRDAGNYRVMPSYYGQNDIGSLDVFADTRLGMNFVPPVILPPSLSDVPTSGLPNLSVKGGSITFRPVDDTTNSSGFRSAVTTTTSGITITSVSATADAGATTDTGTTVGGVTIGAGASGNANAGCNVVGCTAGVSGNAETHVELSANEKLKLEADAYAKVKAGLSMSGVEVSATTVAQVAAEVGGSRNAGGAGDINYGVIAAAVSGAQATSVLGWNDGITFKTGAQVGVGVSAGATAGISGSVGSASVGPSIYSPGSFGGQFSFSPGYSDGTLSVSMNLGAQIGLGGLNLNIDLSLNLKPVSDFFSNDRRTRGEKERDHAYTLGESGDHLGQIAYLQANKSWRSAPNRNKLEDTLNRYNAVLVGMKEATQYELDKQSYVLNLMRTDPKAALAYVRKENFLADQWGGFQSKERQVYIGLDQLGLQLSVSNAQLTVSNKPQ